MPTCAKCGLEIFHGTMHTIIHRDASRNRCWNCISAMERIARPVRRVPDDTRWEREDALASRQRAELEMGPFHEIDRFFKK